MRLLLCLAAAALAVCQGKALPARVTRGVVGPSFPNFHAVHHGYGATSYQNVQIENHGSVPVPTEDHHPHHQHHVELLAHEVEPVLHYAHRHPAPLAILEDHGIHDAIAVIPHFEGDNHDDHHHHHHHHQHQHLQDYIIIEKEVHEVPVEHAIPVVENHEEDHPQVVALEHDHHGVLVPYAEEELQHIQLQHEPHYYGNGYEHDYEYH